MPLLKLFMQVCSLHACPEALNIKESFKENTTKIRHPGSHPPHPKRIPVSNATVVFSAQKKNLTARQAFEENFDRWNQIFKSRILGRIFLFGRIHTFGIRSHREIATLSQIIPYQFKYSSIEVCIESGRTLFKCRIGLCQKKKKNGQARDSMLPRRSSSHSSNSKVCATCKGTNVNYDSNFQFSKVICLKIKWEESRRVEIFLHQN